MEASRMRKSKVTEPGAVRSRYACGTASGNIRAYAVAGERGDEVNGTAPFAFMGLFTGARRTS